MSDYLLLTNGSYLLLTDGVSRIILTSIEMISSLRSTRTIYSKTKTKSLSDSERVSLISKSGAIREIIAGIRIKGI